MIITAITIVCELLTCVCPGWGGSLAKSSGWMRLPARISLTRLMANNNFFWCPSRTIPMSSRSSQVKVVTSSTERIPCWCSAPRYSSSLSNLSHSSSDPGTCSGSPSPTFKLSISAFNRFLWFGFLIPVCVMQKDNYYTIIILITRLLCALTQTNRYTLITFAFKHVSYLKYNHLYYTKPGNQQFLRVWLNI